MEYIECFFSPRCFEDGTCYTFDTTTSHGPMMFVFPLLGVIMPVLAVVTMVSNTIIIVILSRPGMRSPTNCVLLSMAVCDLCTILIPTPWWVIMKVWPKTLHLLFLINSDSSPDPIIPELQRINGNNQLTMLHCVLSTYCTLHTTVNNITCYFLFFAPREK